MSKAEIKKGTCPVCGIGCHVNAHITGGKITRVEPDPESFMNRRLCERAAAAVDYHHHPQRLNHPLKRAGGRGAGKWERISWEQAIDEIAGKLSEIHDSYGLEAVAVLGGSPHGPGDAAAWKWCNLWGTPNFFHLGKNCGEAEFLAECAMYGYDTLAGWVEGLNPEKTAVAVMWGANLSESSPRLWNTWRRARSEGTKIVVIDPRPTACASEADIWLQLRPGTDGALALGMLNVIINEGLYDREFVENWCLGFDELKALVQAYSPQRAAEITWLPAEQLADTARLYATSPAAVITWGVACCHLGKGAGMSAVLGKCWLRAVTGNLDREGSNRFSDWPQHTAFLDEMNWDHQINHPLRTRDNVSAHRWPIASVKALALYREAMRKVYPKGFGAAQYFIYPAPSSVWSAILDGEPYPIKVIIGQGTNTLCSAGNTRITYDALQSDKLALHVSMDHFMTPTAALADYVLPATDALERPNMINMWGMSDSYVGRHAAVEPQHGRRDDYQLWSDLGKRLGQGKYWPDTLEGWLDRLLEPASMSFSEFAKTPGYAPPKEYKRYQKTGFGTFSGKVELVPSILTRLEYDPLTGYKEPAWSPISTPELAKEYPLILISGSRVRTYHHSSLRQMEKLRRRYPYPLLQINPETAAGLGIADGDTVCIETPLGTIKQKAQLVQDMHPRVVHADGYWWYPEQQEADPVLYGVWESNINSILPDSPEVCDYTGDSYFRGLLCKVYKVPRS
jgi:anaerobic selenocysteine-containing dehydrogenase